MVFSLLEEQAQANLHQATHYAEGCNTVVAEGVETEQQRDYLKRQNCDILQGYLFAKPLTASDATDYLQQHMRMSTARYSI